MSFVILIICIACAFILGRLTSFKSDNKIKNLQTELQVMTDSRDRWREKYLVRVMRDKLKEMDCKGQKNAEI